jgi:hypothetical protein
MEIKNYDLRWLLVAKVEREGHALSIVISQAYPFLLPLKKGKQGEKYIN